jgi:DHA2 family multidrug resistance protein
MTCSSFWLMTGWTPDVSQHELITGIVIQGLGLGLVFTPLQLVAFTTLAPSLRTEGASLFALARNIGAAIGVSVTSSLLAHNAQGLHEVIGGSVSPFNRALQALGPIAHGLLDPASRRGAAVLDQAINQQAQIIAYMDDYVLMICTTLPALLLLLLMRRPPRVAVRAKVREGAVME